MSWEIIYNRLFELTVEHSFFKGEVSDAFGFTMFPETSKILKSHGVLFKELQYGFDLIYRSNNTQTGPSIPFTESQTLYFGLKLEDKELLNFTELPSKSDYSDIYICNGSYGTSELSLSTVTTRSNVFTEYCTSAYQAVKLIVLDMHDNILFESVQLGDQDEDDPGLYNNAFSINLGSQFQSQLLKIKTIINGVEEIKQVFVSNSLRDRELIGVVILEFDENIVYDDNLPYRTKLKLAASSSFWKYCFELTRDFTNGTFSLSSSDDGSIVFVETTELDDYITGETVIFISSEEILKSESVNNNIELSVTSDTHDLALSGLPTPSPYTPNSTIYLKI